MFNGDVSKAVNHFLDHGLESTPVISLVDSDDEDDVVQVHKTLATLQVDAESTVNFNESEMLSILTSELEGLHVAAEETNKNPSTGKNTKKRVWPDKQKVTQTIVRLSFVTRNSVITFGRLPKQVSSFLHPLVVNNIIKISAAFAGGALPAEMRPFTKIPVQIKIDLTSFEIFDQFKSEALDNPFVLNFFSMLQYINGEEPVADTETASKVSEEELGANVVSEVLCKTDSEHEEANDPEGMTVVLRQHQRTALKWMLKQEQSISVYENPLWKRCEFADGTPYHVNNYTKQAVVGDAPNPDPLCGGILGDDMGLGKTICCIALILASKQVEGKKTNLVVCPTSLLGQWQAELESKTNPRLRILVYHGTDRLKKNLPFAKYDCVLTTYGTLSSDFVLKSALFDRRWKRIILDEAHVIKNRNTEATKAVAAIDAECRWCLTGTPLQNSIDDLYGLIHFLKFQPWNSYAWWSKTIRVPFEQGDKQALPRLHELLGPLMLRRTKESIGFENSLPEKNIELLSIDFSPSERQFYDSLHSHSKAEFNGLVASGGVKNQYAAIFTLLLRLRQACDHPFLVLTNSNKGDSNNLKTSKQDFVDGLKSKFIKEGSSSSTYVEKTIDSLLVSPNDAEECPICLDPPAQPILTKCGHVMCSSCFHTCTSQGPKLCPVCRERLPLKSDISSLESLCSESLDSEIVIQPGKTSIISSHWRPSSKLSILFQKLHEISRLNHRLKSGALKSCEKYDLNDSKKPVKVLIFSQWTNMLDLVEHECSSNKMRFARLDGKLSVSKREQAIELFNNNPDVNIFLISLKAGCLGLNLTTASVVFLCDPWWNPAVERQAIDRVHRIGQSRKVKVYKMAVRNTVEEKLLALQDKKSKMSNDVLEESWAQNGNNAGKLSLNDLLELFK